MLLLLLWFVQLDHLQLLVQLIGRLLLLCLPSELNFNVRLAANDARFQHLNRVWLLDYFGAEHGSTLDLASLITLRLWWRGLLLLTELLLPWERANWRLARRRDAQTLVQCWRRPLLLLLLLSFILQIVDYVVGLVEDALALGFSVAPTALLVSGGLCCTIDAPVLTRFRVVLTA